MPFLKGVQTFVHNWMMSSDLPRGSWARLSAAPWKEAAHFQKVKSRSPGLRICSRVPVAHLWRSDSDTDYISCNHGNVSSKKHFLVYCKPQESSVLLWHILSFLYRCTYITSAIKILIRAVLVYKMYAYQLHSVGVLKLCSYRSTPSLLCYTSVEHKMPDCAKLREQTSSAHSRYF